MDSTASRPWRLLRTTRAIDSPWLTVERNAYELPAGDIVDDFFIVRRKPFVNVVAERDGAVVLIRQYRPATLRDYWCLPSGYIDAGETAAQAGTRELFEETGLRAASAETVAVFDPLPAYLESSAHVVHCRDVAGTAAIQPGTEHIDEVIEVSWPEALNMVDDGRIREMQAAVALQLVWLRATSKDRR